MRARRELIDVDTDMPSVRRDTQRPLGKIDDLGSLAAAPCRVAPEPRSNRAQGDTADRKR